MTGKVFGLLTVIGKNPEFPRGKWLKHWNVKCTCGREKLIYEGSLLNGCTKSCGNCSGIKDIRVGDRFGKLTVIKEKEKINGRWMYLVKCSCGNPEPKLVRNEYLVAKNVKEVGCGNCIQFDIIGKKFGRWTVLKHEGIKSRVSRYLCRCDCSTERSVARDKLLTGESSSCGCLHREISSKIHSNDLVGQSFGFLKVLSRNGSDKSGNAIFSCYCSNCNSTKDIRGMSLKSGQISCGCYNAPYNEQSAMTLRAKTDKKHIGIKRGKLTPIKRALTRNGNQGYECKCDCKNVKVFSQYSITSFKVTDCGCGKSENHLKKLKEKYIGKIFNRLTIKDIYMASGQKCNNARAICTCSCEKEADILLCKVLTNHTRSCGCIFEEQRGENHPNWKPELTDQQRLENETRCHDPVYRRWRKRVIQKTGAICKKCGNIDDLQVHHIVPWSISEELRFDESNGIVLCEICHELFHSIFGQEKEAPEFLKEYLEM